MILSNEIPSLTNSRTSLYEDSGPGNTGLPELDIGVNCDSLPHDFCLHVLLQARPHGKNDTEQAGYLHAHSKMGNAPQLPTQDYQTILTPETKKDSRFLANPLMIMAPRDGLEPST